MTTFYCLHLDCKARSPVPAERGEDKNWLLHRAAVAAGWVTWNSDPTLPTGFAFCPEHKRPGAEDAEAPIAQAPEADPARLIAEGYRQTSGKYGRVARLPPGLDGIEALRRVAPARYRAIVERIEAQAADEYRRRYAQDDGMQLTLSPDQLKAFRTAGGVAS